MNEAQLLSAALVGFLGGVHCFGMCGGVVGALTFTLPGEVRATFRRLLPYLLAYNLGRIGSYTAAGALVGGIGALAADLAGLHRAQVVLAVVAGLFMVVLGLYLGGWWQGLTRLERVGGVLWRRLEPIGRRLLPVRRPGGALAIGLVWGWLPCGLVYSVLVWTLSAGSATNGASLMLAFGLGTLPALLAMGTLAARLARFVRYPPVRWLAGALVATLGVLQVGGAIQVL